MNERPEPDAARLEQMVEAIRSSPSYRLAEADHEFLEADAARPARLALEAMRPEARLQAKHVGSTVVVFGSSRILPPALAAERLAAARAALEREPGDADLERALLEAGRRLVWSRYYDEARLLAREFARHCTGAARREFVVVTGGGPGVMEAANRGAWEEGAPSAGFNIDLPHEQRPNPFITPELAFRFRYFAMRKLHFLLRACALVAMPGGFGTLDEVFEALTLVQTGRIDPMPVVLVGSEYWRRAVDFDFLVAEGFITDGDARLFTIVDSGQEAAAIVRSYYGISA